MARLNHAPNVSLVDMLYFRPTEASCTAFDAALFAVAAAYRGRVRLVVKHTDECGYLFGGWVSGASPTVLMVRDGVMLAELVGELPAREIECLVESSLTSHSVDEPVRRSA